MSPAIIKAAATACLAGLSLLLIASCGGEPLKESASPFTPLPTIAEEQPTNISPDESPTVPASPTAELDGQSEPPGYGSLAWTLEGTDGRGFQTGQAFLLRVNLDPMGRGVSGVQYTIQFPAELVRVAGVEQGDLLGGESLEIRQPGPNAGELVLAWARRGPTAAATPAATVAEINFQMLRAVSAGRNAVIQLRGVKVVDRAFQTIENPALSVAIVEAK